MSETKLSIKNQLYLGAIPWLVIFGVKLTENVSFLSQGIKDLLTIVSWIALIIILGYALKKKEEVDESANKILGKVDGICLKSVLWVILVIAIFVDMAEYSSSGLTLKSISNILCLMILGSTLLRAILFSYYDRKGI